MVVKDPGIAAADRRSSRRALIAAAAVLLAGQFAVYDLFGLVHGSGLFSLTGALAAAGRHAPRIDVDSAALRSGCMALPGIGALLVGLRSDYDIMADARKWPIAVAVLGSIFGGIAIDMAIGPTLIDGMMTGRGYRHCAVRDHVYGHGRGRIDFAAYVAEGAGCFAPGAAFSPGA